MPGISNQFHQNVVSFDFDSKTLDVRCGRTARARACLDVEHGTVPGTADDVILRHVWNFMGTLWIRQAGYYNYCTRGRFSYRSAARLRVFPLGKTRKKEKGKNPEYQTGVLFPFSFFLDLPLPQHRCHETMEAVGDDGYHHKESLFAIEGDQDEPSRDSVEHHEVAMYVLAAG